MIFSKQDLFSEGQAVTATAASTNVIDLGEQGTVVGQSAALAYDHGQGGYIPLQIQVTETFATLTSLTVTVETDDNAAFSSATTVATTIATAVASLKAGYVFELTALPIRVTERYVRLKYTVGGSNATAGKITAGIPASHSLRN